MARMDVLTGTALGPYRLHELLGRGGMGSVYRAVHETLEQSRAIKILPAHFASDPDFVERFRREAAIAAKLHHPNIVQIYDIGERDGLHYIVMQFVAGRSLRDVIRAESPVSVERGVRLLRQLADALDFAHARGVVHRDIKPGNIIVRDDDHVTLVDFGIARAADEARLTRTGLMVGTPEYMAPEVVSGSGEGPSADLYALGVVAYELLTGRVPFGGGDTPALLYAQVHKPPPSPREFRPDLPETVVAALLRQLAKDPADRFQSATSFVDGLLGQEAGGSDSVWGTVVDLRAEPVTPLGGPANGPPSRPSPMPLLGSTPAARTGPPAATAATLTPPAASAGAATHPTVADETPTPTRLSSPTVERGAPFGRGARSAVAALALVLVGGAIAVWTLGPFESPRRAASTPVATSPAAALAATVAATPPPTAPPAPTRVIPTATPVVPRPTAVAAPAGPSPEQRLQAARQALEAGNFATAIDQLRALRQSNPSTPGLDDVLLDAHNRYGAALLDQGQLDAADAQFSEALALRPGDANANRGREQVTLARHWAAMEASWGRDDDAAIGSLEAIMQIDPGFRETRQKLYALLVAKADRLLAAGERDTAAGVLQRALEVNPDGLEARQRLLQLTPTPEPTAEPTAPPQPAAPAPAQRAPAPARQAPAPAQSNPGTGAPPKPPPITP